jgi:acyl-CoA synthetase (AMP-forming)/AMP-acid ligase II
VNGYVAHIFDVGGLTLFYSWVRTGDSVVINEDGELFVVDRVKVCFAHLK